MASLAAAPKPAKPDPKEGLPTYPQAPASKSKPAAVKLPLKPGNNETIALVGNMLGERMLYFGHFETLLHQRFPEQRLVLRNLCNPGDTPGFRPNSSRFDPWAFPGAEKFNQNKKTHYGIGHYPSPDEWLHEVRADTIVGFFGYNESFDGPVLFLAGGRSRYIAAGDMAAITHHFPKAEIEIIAKSGHNPHMETRDELIAHIERHAAQG